MDGKNAKNGNMSDQDHRTIGVKHKKEKVCQETSEQRLRVMLNNAFMKTQGHGESKLIMCKVSC